MYDEGMNPVMVHAQDVQSNLQAGFTLPTPEEVSAYHHEEKYGGVGQQLKTAAEGAASAATFGASTGLERAIGVKPEDIQGRREENPISYGLGQGAGLVGSVVAAPEVGAASLMEKAGIFGAKAAFPSAKGAYEAAQALKGARAAGEGVEAAKAAYTAAREAQPVYSKIGSEAANQAIQMGLFQGGDEVSKMFSGAPGYENPAAATQTALSNIGMSAMLGGVAGGAFGSVSPLWDATVGPRVESFLNPIKNRGNGESLPILKGADEVLTKAGATPEQKAFFSQDPAIQRIAQQLMESGTPQAEAYQEAFNQTKSNVAGNLQSVFRSETPMTAFEAGEKAKESMLAKAEVLEAQGQEKYKAITGDNAKIVIPDEAKDAFHAKLVQQGKDFGEVGGPYEKVFEGFADRIKAQPTLEKQDKVISDLNSELQQARITGNTEKVKALAQVKNSVRDFQDEVITQGNPELLAKRKEARAEWAKYMSSMEDMASMAKAGRAKSLGQFEASINDIPSATLADRLFQKKNIEGMRFLKENHPDIFETIINQKKAELLEKSMKGEEFMHNTLLNKYRDLPKEMKDLMFTPEQQSTIENSGNILRIGNKRLNPSGTAKSFSKMWENVIPGVVGVTAALAGHNPFLAAIAAKAAEYLGRNVPDAVRVSLLKFLGSSGPVDAGAWKIAADFINHAYKGQRFMEKAAKNIFDQGPKLSVIIKQSTIDSLDKKLKKIQEDPNQLMNVGGKVSCYLPDQGMSLAQTTATAANYLNGLRPNTQKANPLDSEPVVSPEQKAKFQKALTIAEQPMVLMNEIKDGTIVPEDIGHLNAMYPGLYGQMKQQITSAMIDRVHGEEPIPYKTRLGVATFLGQPLDSTMTPQAILALNPQLAPAQPFQQLAQSGQQPKQPRHSSMKNISKLPQSYMSSGQALEAKKLKV